MATTKKVTPETKPESVKVTEVKAEIKPAAKAEVKPAAKAEVKTAAKPAAKAEAKAAEPAKKAPAKKTAAKKAPVKKTVVKEDVYVQFSDKSYSTEDLIKSVRDICKYDLQMKAADVKTVEVYVKPEEATAYYVVNGDVNGSFPI